MVSVSKGPGPQERPFLREVAYPSKCNRADNFNQHKLESVPSLPALRKGGIWTVPGGWVTCSWPEQMRLLLLAIILKAIMFNVEHSENVPRGTF